jgi:uncharacterized protein (DUF2267 family)
VDYRGFITTVEREAAIPDDDQAERAACLTLHTLAQRITPGEAEDLAERLPEELQPCLRADEPLQRFHVDEFLQRIEAELAADHATAERTARGVFTALWKAVGPDEFADMRAQLPRDFEPLLDAAVGAAEPRPRIDTPQSPAVTLDEFLDRVAERAGLDRETARRAAEAVLEVLARRITRGEVEDLEPFLPPELREAMERGRPPGPATNIPMSLDEFLDRLARLEHVDRANATKHARAVMHVLREVVGPKEWHDTLAQLPGEYRILLKQG